MNGHVENKWARLPKAWEDPGNTPNEEALVNEETATRTLSNDIDGIPLSYEEEINKEEDAASINPPMSCKKMTQVSDGVEWAEARDECLRVTEEALATLQRDVAKSLVTVLDSLDRGQRLRRRAKDAERRSEKERWRKSRAEMEKLMKRLAEKWEGGRRTKGWSCEKEEEEDEEDEAISGMCLDVRSQVQMLMEKAESEREEEVTESDSMVAKQELAIMEVLMDQLGAVEETCRGHCKIIQDRMTHLWEKIEKNRSVRTENSGISEQFPSSVTPLAILKPCLVRGRRPLLPPIASLNEEGGERSVIHIRTGAPTQGFMWHMEPLAENHRNKKKRKKKVEMTGGEEEEVPEKNEECQNIRKSWKQRLTEWLHAPLCGCAVRCY